MWKYAPWALAAFFAVKWQEAQDLASRTKENFSRFVTAKKDEDLKQQQQKQGEETPLSLPTATKAKPAKP